MTGRLDPRALGGEAHGNRILAPGPGHSPRDRSMSIFISSQAPDGFVVHSHAGDDPLLCRDYVRERLGLSRRRDEFLINEKVRSAAKIQPDDRERATRALALWQEARPARGTLVEAYLARRGLVLSDEALKAIRLHPSCPFNKTPLHVRQNGLEWLRVGRTGLVVVDRKSVRWLLQDQRLALGNRQFVKALEHDLSRKPRFVIARPAARDDGRAV
jgi:hypothetical protein